MQSKIAEAINLKSLPVAVILSDEKPGEAIQFREKAWGCVANVMLAASKGRTAVFDRNTFGCQGGGTGLGFGNCYTTLPIHEFLSTGFDTYVTADGETIKGREGEYYSKAPDIAQEWVTAMPMRQVPTTYVVFKPLQDVKPEEQISSVIYFVNPDQLSALVVLANYGRGRYDSVMAPFCAGCQTLLFGYQEEESALPRATIGFFDISVRKYVDRDQLTFTMPYSLFQEMEANVEGSFLKKNPNWEMLLKRNA